MSKRKTCIILLICFITLFFLGCSDEVNFSKGDKVVGSFIEGQVKNDKKLVNSLINEELKEKLEEGDQYFWDKYDLINPTLKRVNIYEMQSSENKKLISASYLVEAKEEKVNVASLYFLEKVKDKWIIEYIEEIAININIE